MARDYPYGQFNFQVKVDGDGLSAEASFSEVTGLTTDTNIIEYREGDEQPLTTRKLPGLMKYNNIVLKRGYTSDKALWTWRKKVIDGQSAKARCSGTITLLDEAKQPALHWRFVNGWPCKWEGPAMNAKTSEVAIETLEICHEGLELVE